jgi:hypothetical protein
MKSRTRRGGIKLSLRRFRQPCDDVLAVTNTASFFKGLIDRTAESGFKMKEVSADKGYLGASNMLATLQRGAGVSKNSLALSLRASQSRSADRSPLNTLFGFSCWHWFFSYMLFRMGSIGDSYRLLSREASGQVGEYQSALQIDQITNFSSLLKKRRHQFHFWFWLTVVLYLALGGLIL